MVISFDAPCRHCLLHGDCIMWMSIAWAILGIAPFSRMSPPLYLLIDHMRCAAHRKLTSRKQDAWIFGAGATFTLFSFWVIWHYLG